MGSEQFLQHADSIDFGTKMQLGGFFIRFVDCGRRLSRNVTGTVNDASNVSKPAFCFRKDELHSLTAATIRRSNHDLCPKLLKLHQGTDLSGNRTFWISS